jgi:hypothetical protein
VVVQVLEARFIEQWFCRTFVCAGDVGTRQETPWVSTACYGDNITFLYVDDVRTSQDTRLGSTTYYSDSFTFLFAFSLIYEYRLLY